MTNYAVDLERKIKELSKQSRRFRLRPRLEKLAIADYLIQRERVEESGVFRIPSRLRISN